MKRHLLLFVFWVTALCLSGGERPKYIFLFIGDGMSTPQRMVAEEFAKYTGHGELTLNHLMHQSTTRSSSANALITDSAAAGTAIACGEKTNNGRIGMDTTGKRKLESVAELAKKEGYKVGILTSVTINHATPAVFYAHRPSRSQYYEISQDLIASNFDFFGGGGLGGLTNKKKPEINANYVYAQAEKSGYKVVHGKQGLMSLKPSDGKVIAACAQNCYLDYEIDNDGTCPRLWEILTKAIEILDNPNGFFIMTEGGSIDSAGHANDAATNLREVLGLDKAVRVAVEFAKKHPQETLIIVTGDHETGGLTMGFAGSGQAIHFQVLAAQKCSIKQYQNMMIKLYMANPNAPWEDVQKIVVDNFGFVFDKGNGRDKHLTLSEDDVIKLQHAFESRKLHELLRLMVAQKAGIAWSSGSHTALPVLTTSQGKCSEKFEGFMENTEIATRLKQIISSK